MSRRSPFKTLFAAAQAARFSSRTRSNSRLARAAGGRRLHLERLEDRVVLAAAGDLDPTFGIGGLVTTDSIMPGGPHSVVVQADGKIVVAGSSEQGSAASWDFAAARYNADGSLDTSFGVGGKVIIDFGSTSEFVHADFVSGAAVQADGKIVLGGYTIEVHINDVYDENGDLLETHQFHFIDCAVVRLNANGSLDYTFDTDGKQTIDFGSDEDYCQDVAVQADGKIVLAGYSDQGATGSDFAVARLNADGNLDDSFDADGKQTIDFGFDEAGLSMAAQADGKIVLAGISFNQAQGTVLVRLNDDGTLDSTLDGDGKLKIADDLLGYSAAVQADGKIVLAGYSDQGATGQDFAVARVNVDGSLDDSFDGDGKQSVDFGGAESSITSMALQADGKIVLAGTISSGSSPFDFSMARLTNDGQLDTSFGADGKQTIDFGFDFEFASSVTLQPDGKIVVAGSSGVARLLGITDTDDDGIEDAVDIQPLTFSHDFSDGTTSGTIANRADQNITIVDAPNSADGVLITADFLGGAGPATIEVVAGASTLTLSAGDQVTVTHGSVIVNNPPTVSGPVLATATEDENTFSVNLLAGASDADPEDVLAITNLSLVSGSGVGFSVVGSILTIDPQAYNSLADGSNAVTQYTYDIVDGNGGLAPQSATVTIQGLNDAPTAKVDQLVVGQGTSNNVLKLTANDVDPDGDLLLIQSVSATARNATLTIADDQRSVLYTPRTPTSTGTDSFSYSIVDSAGATSTTTVGVTILANTVVAEPTTLANEIFTQQSSPDEPMDVVVNLSPASYGDVIDAINSLPPVVEGGQIVFVTLAISDGVYPGAVLSPPEGVVIILNGFNGGITLVGASPALTVSSGEVIIENGVILTNSTDAPTILVTAGHLRVRNSTIEESTNFARAAIRITGGTVDLGTASSLGGNTLIVHGEGEFIVNTSGTDVPAVGNVFLSNSEGNDAPTIGAIGDQQYTQTEVTVQVTALDPDSDPLSYSAAFVSKSGSGAAHDPTGFSIDSSGRFRWTPGAGQLGQYMFQVAVSDGELQTTQDFTVTTLGVVDGVLTIVGTGGADRIFVMPTAGDVQRLTVRINEQDVNFQLKPQNNPDNPYNDVERVRIHSLGGDDEVTIHTRVPVDAELHGGEGDDRLQGGDGHDVIFGGLGNDSLWGGDGHDFLIGGEGSDRLHGQKGNDILMAGRFADHFDTRFANLRAISAGWAAGFADSDLTDDNEDDDILDELLGDVLNGGQGADWFLVGSGDQTGFNAKKNGSSGILVAVFGHHIELAAIEQNAQAIVFKVAKPAGG